MFLIWTYERLQKGGQMGKGLKRWRPGENLIAGTRYSSKRAVAGEGEALRDKSKRQGGLQGLHVRARAGLAMPCWLLRSSPTGRQ